MVWNVSKYIGIPASLKTAKNQLNKLITHKEKTIRTELMKGKYLCIKKQKITSYGRPSFAYPIYASKNKIKNSIVCKKVK